MPQRTVRARQLPDGHFEFLELRRGRDADGFEVIVNEVEATTEVAAACRHRLVFGAWNMGVPLLPITRDVIYDDLV